MTDPKSEQATSSLAAQALNQAGRVLRQAKTVLSQNPSR